MFIIKKSVFIFLCLIALLLGTGWFLYQKSWLIFQIPSFTPHHIENHTQCVKIIIFIQHRGKLLQEPIDLMLSQDHQANIERIVNQFLQIHQQYKLINPSIYAQSAIITKNNDAIISLNLNPFLTQSSSHQKLILIQNLIKTLKQLPIQIQGIKLLVDHQPINDPHLDLQITWPITNRSA